MFHGRDAHVTRGFCKSLRLHYFDFAKAPVGILNEDMQTLNPEKLDQFDWLIAQLKENGIYVDINLHVCRPYPGQPKEVRSKRRASRAWCSRTSCRNTRSASKDSTARPRLWISSRLRGPTPRTPLWML